MAGEMERHAGSVRMGGRLAYVAQQAWIVNDSLQSNVLFGQELDERRWDDCVHACSLQQDLEVLLICLSLTSACASFCSHSALHFTARERSYCSTVPPVHVLRHIHTPMYASEPYSNSIAKQSVEVS